MLESINIKRKLSAKDIKEIINGERKNEIMNDETRETLEKVVEYTKEEKKKQYYKMRNIIGIIITYFLLFYTKVL